MAVGKYIGQLRKSIENEVILNSSGYSLSLSVEKELILFRILQEAINNILTRAEASLVEVDLNFQKEQLQLQITGNGRGFDPS